MGQLSLCLNVFAGNVKDCCRDRSPQSLHRHVPLAPGASAPAPGQRHLDGHRLRTAARWPRRADHRSASLPSSAARAGRPSMTGFAQPSSPGDRRPFGGSGTAAPDRTRRANAQTVAAREDRPGTFSFGPQFTDFFWSILNPGTVRPSVYDGHRTTRSRG